MKFKARSLSQLGDLICGNETGAGTNYFQYRSSSFLTQFFEDIETDFQHDGSTRARWVAEVLAQILTEPSSLPTMPSDTFLRVIDRLMDPADCTNEGREREGAVAELNVVLYREGFSAFYGDDGRCYLRHDTTRQVGEPTPNPHRPLSAAERKQREQLASYLDSCSEDELIENILLPLLRQVGFQRITAAGHRDKALEYGKDIWMKYVLPTTHVLYFGIQAKKGKLDASGMTKSSNANIPEIHNQALMMLGHEIFDPEIGKRVLVDHAFVIAGGDITKQARNWLGNKLDASKRSQIMFMDRNDIINLFVVTSLDVPQPAPAAATTDPWAANNPPF